MFFLVLLTKNDLGLIDHNFFLNMFVLIEIFFNKYTHIMSMILFTNVKPNTQKLNKVKLNK